MTRLYTVAERAPSSQNSPASDLSQALSQAVSQAEQINQITRAAATAAAEAATAVSDGNDPGAGPSGTSTGPDYSTILGKDTSPEIPFHGTTSPYIYFEVI